MLKQMGKPMTVLSDLSKLTALVLIVYAIWVVTP